RQARSDPHRITVVNRIPPTLLDVLRQQFELMHSWMEPVFRAVQSQQTEMVGLKRSLDETLASYASLIEKLGVARSRSRRNEE
ncbi:MAG: hypothetical protein KDA79_25370, partial [Planctomycetaceae bacterium]|nr:hypothetical protein [Planctomycetaceae bacterium]